MSRYPADPAHPGFARWIVDLPVCAVCRSAVRGPFAWTCLTCDAVVHRRCIARHRRVCSSSSEPTVA